MKRTLEAKFIWNIEIEKGILFAIHHVEKLYVGISSTCDWHHICMYFCVCMYIYVCINVHKYASIIYIFYAHVYKIYVIQCITYIHTYVCNIYRVHTDIYIIYIVIVYLHIHIRIYTHTHMCVCMCMSKSKVSL